MLEINARKLKALCREDLRTAALDGTASPLLYMVCRLIAVFHHGDVWANEGFNHLLKSVIERSHNIRHALLDARSRIKKELGVGVRGVSTRWREIKPRAVNLVNKCVDEYNDVKKRADISRYAKPPLPIQDAWTSIIPLDAPFPQCRASTPLTRGSFCESHSIRSSRGHWTDAAGCGSFGDAGMGASERVFVGVIVVAM